MKGAEDSSSLNQSKWKKIERNRSARITLAFVFGCSVFFFFPDLFVVLFVVCKVGDVRKRGSDLIIFFYIFLFIYIFLFVKK